MKLRLLFPAAVLLLACSAGAGELSPSPQVGDCAIFREGGGGMVLKAPSYWLMGTIEAVVRDRRVAGPCPQIGKPLPAYTREDWARVAAATPCVTQDADVREVDVLRIRLRVDEWETPWSHTHGSTGWLFRGHFLDQPLKKGERIEMDASWLARCEAKR